MVWAMSQVIDTLPVPIVVAPMAGGPTTVALVKAAAAAGCISALAWGTIQAREAAEHLRSISGAYGINLFYPQRRLSGAEMAAARAIAEEAGRAPGHGLAAADYTFGWQEKFELALGSTARMVWSMFGCFSPMEIERLHSAGKEAWVTVTNEAEACEAHARGADVLCVQGPEAGGHRGTWDFTAEPDPRPLPALVGAVHEAVPSATLVAAGGLRRAEDVEGALGWPGVRAVSCGSAFLLTGEAGTSDANRSLIAEGGTTVSTRALSGRYARGMETAYTRAHPDMPPIYPHLSTILAERRAAGEREVSYCLVGINPHLIRGGSAAEVVAQLSGSGH